MVAVDIDPLLYVPMAPEGYVGKQSLSIGWLADASESRKEIE